MSDLSRDIDVCLRARVTLLLLSTSEDGRALEQLKSLCERSKRGLFLWDHADYFRKVVGNGPEPQAARDPISALEAIEKAQGESLYLLRDFHQCWKNQPKVVRKLRNVAQALKYTRKSIVVTAPSNSLPEELKDDAVVIDVPLPDSEELLGILSHLEQTPGVRVDLDQRNRQRLIDLALGLSANQAQRVFSKALITEGVLDERDLEVVAQEKREIIRDSGALEFSVVSETIDDVGGLEVLKDWLRQRELAFSEEARDYGLPSPKGIALIGIPGSGKSLSAKMVASLWHLPLIRLDVGALFGGLVGESEANTRKALHLVEAVAPCVLWIDELEKALSVGDGDGGTGRRVLGSLLTWMQDKKRPVFIVATANDIERLPPELLRRGRFDEIFFLDLPNQTERKAIFTVHLKKHGRNPADFDLEALASTAEGYVGAEIEQSVIDGLFRAYSDPSAFGREVTTADIEAALHHLVPMSRAQREHIQFLRTWVIEGRAQSASRPDRPEAPVETLPLQVAPA